MLRWHSEHMENNDSPYIYEKPLRSELKKRSKRLAGLSALGLVGMVGIFGGSAIANTITTVTQEGSAAGVDVVDVADIQTDPVPATEDPNVVQASLQESSAEPAPVISVPLQEAKPRPTAPKIELPALPTQNFGNTSSATPLAGSVGNAPGSAPANYAARGERHERDDSDNDSNEREYEDD